MHRTYEQIMQHSEQMAEFAREWMSEHAEEVQGRAVERLRQVAADPDRTEQQIREAVRSARLAEISWQEIGEMIGMSAEDARRKYQLFAGW